MLLWGAMPPVAVVILDSRLRSVVEHVQSAGPLVFASILYAKLLAIPLVVSYHTHVPDYIPKYTWKASA